MNQSHHHQSHTLSPSLPSNLTTTFIVTLKSIKSYHHHPRPIINNDTGVSSDGGDQPLSPLCCSRALQFLPIRSDLRFCIYAFQDLHFLRDHDRDWGKLRENNWKMAAVTVERFKPVFLDRPPLPLRDWYVIERFRCVSDILFCLFLLYFVSHTKQGGGGGIQSCLKRWDCWFFWKYRQSCGGTHSERREKGLVNFFIKKRKEKVTRRLPHGGGSMCVWKRGCSCIFIHI